MRESSNFRGSVGPGHGLRHGPELQLFNILLGGCQRVSPPKMQLVRFFGLLTLGHASFDSAGFKLETMPIR